MTKQIKQHQCKQCKSKYIKFNSLQVTCSPVCAIQYVKVKRDKNFRKETAKMKRDFNLISRKHQTKLTETVCHRYIRYRDRNNGCISCGTCSGKMNAGHYLSRGAHPELRFEEDNIHLQCERCNSHLSGNLIRYRPNIIKKIGQDRVDWIEGPHKSANRSIEDLITIREHFKSKLKQLEQAA